MGLSEPTRLKEWPREIARDFHVSVETIRRIDRGDTWAWLTPEQPTDPIGEAELKRLADESFARLHEKLKEGK
jgi:hypothetical protein